MLVSKISKLVLKSLFKKPATKMYPVVPRAWEERTRGHIGIVEADCILCGICMRKCPTNCITVDRNQRKWIIERMQCIQCGCCVEVCPKKCLTMEQAYTTPETYKVVDTHDIPAPPPKPAPPKPEAPKADAPPAAEPKAEASKAEAPAVDLSKAEPSAAEA